jgi:hypothetical protein
VAELDFFMGVSFDLKSSALLCHESQFSGPKLKSMESWIRKRCHQMAENEEFDLAEGFHHVINKVTFFWRRIRQHTILLPLI